MTTRRGFIQGILAAIVGLALPGAKVAARAIEEPELAATLFGYPIIFDDRADPGKVYLLDYDFVCGDGSGEALPAFSSTEKVGEATTFISPIATPGTSETESSATRPSPDTSPLEVPDQHTTK